MSVRNLFADFNQVDEPTRKSERLANSEVPLHELVKRLVRYVEDDEYQCEMISPNHIFKPGTLSYCRTKRGNNKSTSGCKGLTQKPCEKNTRCEYKTISRGGTCEGPKYDTDVELNTHTVESRNPVEYNCPICSATIDSDTRWGFKCGHYACRNCFTTYVTSRLFYCETCNDFATPQEGKMYDGYCYGTKHDGQPKEYHRTRSIECFLCRTESDRCYAVSHPRE